MKRHSSRVPRPVDRIRTLQLRTLAIAAAGVVFASLASVSAATAQPGEAKSPDRISSVIVFGNDPCPPAAHDQIVVCGRESESERFRIPKSLRAVKYSPPAQNWTSRVHTLDDVPRAGRPNSCSVVGTGGQTGCYADALERWFADRR